jgi:hypothetical protein
MTNSGEESAYGVYPATPPLPFLLLFRRLKKKKAAKKASAAPTISLDGRNQYMSQQNSMSACFTYAAIVTPAIAPLLKLLPLFENADADAALFEIGGLAATVGEARLVP